jgi:hypothetical protein
MDPQFPEPVASRRSLRSIIGLIAGTGALLATWWGLSFWESHRSAQMEGSDPATGIWSWIGGSLLMALAGLLAGFSVRGVVPGRGFMGGRVVAMGAVPLIVGLTYPMVTLGLWPFTMLGGRVLDVLLTPELALVAWVLVGLSLSIGLVADREII